MSLINLQVKDGCILSSSIWQSVPELLTSCVHSVVRESIIYIKQSYMYKVIWITEVFMIFVIVLLKESLHKAQS